MDGKYRKYAAYQLLNDDYFLESELHPTEESRLFWDDLARKDKAVAGEIENARLILARVKRNSHLPDLPPEEERELWENITLVNKRVRQRKRTLFTAISAAAAVVALLFVLNIRSGQEPVGKQTDYLSLIESAQLLTEDSGDIQLVMSDKKKYNLEGKELEIEYEEEGDIRINSEKITLENVENQVPVFNTLIVPAGKRSNLILADGTKVWVNSGSKVVYPARFEGGTREIFIEGEAYLDVSRNEELPFIVKTRQLDIKVLGTQFNVLSLADELTMEVVLVSGQVEVKTKDSADKILAPHELFKYDISTGETSITTVDITDHIAWKDGYYPFTSQPMDVLLKKIARYYGIQISWDKKVSALSCSGKLDLRNDPAEVFSLLKEAAPITIEERNGEYLVKVKP